MKTRAGTPADVFAFRKLWKAYLEELHGMGGEILPTDRTMRFFEYLYLQACNVPKVAGAAVFAEDAHNRLVGVLLWTPMDEPPWDSEMKGLVQGWGTYVEPDSRGEGVSSALRAHAAAQLKHHGFSVVMGSAHVTNDRGLLAGESAGFEPYQRTHLLRL